MAQSQSNIVQMKSPDGEVVSIDLGSEPPNSPKARQALELLTVRGFTPIDTTYTPLTPGTPAAQPGSHEQMQGVGPMALRDAAIGGLGSVISNTALAPFEGGQLQAGPMGRQVAESVVPSTEQQLMKESLLALTGFAGTPVRLAHRLALGIGRILSPAAIDLATGKDPNPLELGAVLAGELGGAITQRFVGKKLGNEAIRQYEQKVGDEIAVQVASSLPDVKMGQTTADMYQTFAARTFSDSKAAKVLGKEFDTLDNLIDKAFGSSTIDLSTRPNLAMAIDMYRKSLPGYPGVRNTMTTTVQETRKAMHYAGDVAFDYSKAPGTVEQTASGASMRQLAAGAKEEYKQLVQGRVGPDALARLNQLDEQYGNARLLHDFVSPAANPGFYSETAQGPRVTLEKVRELSRSVNELEKRSIGAVADPVSSGMGAGTAAEIGGFSPRVSGTPLGQGVGFAGVQVQIPTLKTPVTRPPRVYTGPIEAGLLRLLDAAGWTDKE